MDKRKFKRLKRFCSDIALGQHYHLLFHKKRQNYASPVCGITAIILYSVFLIYAVFQFLYVIGVYKNYNIETSYNPLSLSPTGNVNDKTFTVGQFFEGIDLNIYYDRSLSQLYNCQSLRDNIVFETLNPPMQVNFTVEFDEGSFKCLATPDESMYLNDKLL